MIYFLVQDLEKISQCVGSLAARNLEACLDDGKDLAETRARISNLWKQIRALVVELPNPETLLVIRDLFLSHCLPPLLVLASNEQGPDIVKMTATLNISAYINMNQPPDEWFEDLSSVLGKNTVLPYEWLRRSIAVDGTGNVQNMNQYSSDSQTRKLTKQEILVSQLISQGMNNKEIAAELKIDLCTVKTHVHRILGKLGLANRSQISDWVNRGFIIPEPVQTTA